MRKLQIMSSQLLRHCCIPIQQLQKPLYSYMLNFIHQNNKTVYGQQIAREYLKSNPHFLSETTLRKCFTWKQNQLVPPKGTGLVYDERLTAHFCAWNQDFTEQPERIEASYARIQELGLPDRCIFIPVRPATDDEIRLCHTDRHIELLRETQLMNSDELSSMSQSYDYIYFHNKVNENARLALGGIIDLTEQVVSGQLQNGMAVIRPPGHHAMAEEYSGYCYFNNVAIAAQMAINKHGLERVLIVDWDVHHGQGIQFHFYDDPRVLYFSIHRYEHGDEWPHLRESEYDYIGKDRGKGFNINVPLNELVSSVAAILRKLSYHCIGKPEGIGCDNSDYLAIFFNLLLPVAYEFQPQLVLVAAGYDAAIGCPEGEMRLTPACFAHFVNLLKPLACGKIVLVLEGGYGIKTLAEGVALSLRALLGDPTPNIDPISGARKSVVESILNAVKALRGLHPSLAYQDILKEGERSNHEWQMHVSSRSNKNLRTQENRPDRFPLVQECFDKVPDEVLAAINQEIDLLQRNTILSKAPNRCGLLWYTPAQSQNGKNGSALEKFKKNGLLSRCQRLQDDSKTSDQIHFCVSLAVDAVLDKEVQSCIFLPSNFQDQSEEVMAKLNNEFAQSAIACVQKDISTKRTLILNLVSENQLYLPVTMTDKNHNLLVVSVGSSAEGDQRQDGNQIHFINIPLDKKQLQNGDIIAAFQQVVLPISYEFAPDLVFVSLGVKKESGDYCFTAEVMGHILVMLQGLARRQLFLFFKPSEGDQYMAVVAECISSLLGDPCSLLTPCLPQTSVVEVIKAVQDKHKSVWKCLQFREKLPPPLHC